MRWIRGFMLDLSGVTGCASTAQITSGGRTHPRRLLVELGSLRVRAGKPARAEPRDKAHVWWVSNFAGRNACEA